MHPLSLQVARTTVAISNCAILLPLNGTNERNNIGMVDLVQFCEELDVLSKCLATVSKMVGAQTATEHVLEQRNDN